MTNKEIVKQIIEVDEEIEIIQKEINILKRQRDKLKSQIKADNIEIEEFLLMKKLKEGK